MAFGHFATARLAAGSKVTCLDAAAQTRLAGISTNPSHTVLLPLLVTTADMIGILGFLQETGTASVAQIEDKFNYLRREKIALSLLWMAKFGVVRITG